MIAFNADALWTKSAVFIQRGIRARDEGDFSTFHMWAALALELLGKAALARIHPALVADPTKFESLLVACGRNVTDDTRSIAAKTTYERLGAVSKDFDEKAKRFSMLMANRRNEELHSASSPTSDLDPRAWVPEYWRITEVILKLTERDLNDWVGAAEATRAREVSADASRVVAAAVESRIERCRRELEEKYPASSPNREAIVEAVRKTLWPAAAKEFVQSYERYIRVDCPACGTSGWLFGDEAGRHRHAIEYDPDSESAWQVEEVFSFSEAFACALCELRLVGRVELDIAKLPGEFTEEQDVEPDYEPDYGND